VSSASSGCSEGDAESCTVACSYNAASACNEAGRAYELGVGVTRSTVAANTFYRKACDLGDYNGCYNAAYLLEHGIAGRHDPGCALALYRRACDEGSHPMSCMSVGIIYRAGAVDVPRDEARAIAAFRKACDAGHTAACAELAKTTPLP